MSFTPSKYQQKIFEWVLMDQGSNLVVEARAGSGKSKTLQESLKLISEPALILAFNKHIQVEFSEKVRNSNVDVLTYHAYGNKVIGSSMGRVKIDNDKVYSILEGGVLNKYEDRGIFYPVKRLVSLLKSSLIEPTPENIEDLMIYHGIEAENGNSSKIVTATQNAFQKSIEMTDIIDFDDMIYFPVHYDLPHPQKYGFVGIDELQDTNKPQIELALKAVEGRIAGLGDSWQSIYAFRGADSNAVPNLIARLQADTLPLSITYRNPRKVVELVNQTYPEIRLEAAPWAEEGREEWTTATQVYNQITHGDTILCRTNAPLVSACFALIAKDMKAQILGRKIGDGLIELVKRFKTQDIGELMTKIRDYENEESYRLQMAGKWTQAQHIQDRCWSLIALSNECHSTDDVINKIKWMFTDDVKGVTLSTVHKAKGKEWPSVYVLHPELMPHPMGMKQEWSKAQEHNIRYVAWTRTLQNLYRIEGEMRQ